MTSVALIDTALSTTVHTAIYPSVLQVEFMPAAYTVSEADGIAMLGITKLGINERPVVVQFSTENGTATGTVFP